MTVSAERLHLALLWQDAAQVELEGLLKTRDAITKIVEQGGGESVEYPRMRALDAEIEQARRSLAQRSHKLEELRKQPDDPTPSLRPTSRLALLVQRQEEAASERRELCEARDEIQRQSDAAGQVDLDDEQDRRFRELTAEIADVDEEMRVRDEEIERLAAFGAVNV